MPKNKKKEISPILITGVWRSGTTLVSRILNNHPDLAVTYDTVHFMRFSFNKYNPIHKKKNVIKLINDTRKRLLKRYDLNICEKDVLKIINGKYTYQRIYDALMQVFLLKSNKKNTWGEKTNLVWTKIPNFFKMYPKGRVLHIVRDPRAVLFSWKKFTQANGNDYLDSILNCYDSMSKALLYKNIYKHKSYKLITYEELVSNPSLIVKSVCKKFNIKYDPIMLETKNFTDKHGNKWKANSIHKKRVMGISKSMINKWKKNLNNWEIFLIEAIMKDLFRHFDYKKTKTIANEEIIKKIIYKIEKSKLALDGIIRFALSKKGFERYPSDPILKINWQKSKYEKKK